MVTTGKAQILIRGLSPATLDALRERAKRNHRSTVAEARLALDWLAREFVDEEARLAERVEAIRVLREIRARAGRVTDNSADMIRAARDER